MPAPVSPDNTQRPGSKDRSSLSISTKSRMARPRSIAGNDKGAPRPMLEPASDQNIVSTTLPNQPLSLLAVAVSLPVTNA